MAAKVVSFINLKGGVGKTTLALAFGEGMGQKVLMVDIDAQYNLSSSLLSLTRLEQLWKEGKSIYDMFKAELDGRSWDVDKAIVADCSNIQGNQNLHTIICSPDLGQFDEDMLERWAAGKQPPKGLHTVLGNYISKVKSRYNWIIIDCPPSLSIFTSNAILCSDYWIAPLIPEALSLYGIPMIQRGIGDLKRKYSFNIDFAGSILNRLDISRGDHARQAEDVYKSGGKFRPFDCWIGDWKPLYIVSDYNYPFVTFFDWHGNACKWSHAEHKYGWLYTAQNNGDSMGKQVLQNKLGLGSQYRIWNVIQGLTMEFKKNCR